MSADVNQFKAMLGEIAGGAALSRSQAVTAFETMMAGDATPAQMAGFLMALRVRGETVEEIVAGASVLRAKMSPIKAPAGSIDTCGTGGDASGTYNISTASALVIAACGVPVAKHGNRSLSSKSGSSDVLGALGVAIDAPFERIEEAIRDAGIGFMMAPRHHGAMRHVAGPRVELGTRTIFNLLGPLANPASVKRQVMGVFDAKWIEPIAEVLGALGSERVWVVHGAGGLDELSTCGPTDVAEWTGTTVKRFTVTPEDAGLPQADLAQLKGGDAGHNARAIQNILRGGQGPFRDATVLAAAAGLVVAEKAADLRDGAAMADAAMRDGRAAETLAKLVAITTRDES